MTDAQGDDRDHEHRHDEDADGEGSPRDHDHDHHHHHHHEHDVDHLCAAVVTVSSSRSIDDDPAGDAICDALTATGGEVVTRELIADSYDGIQSTVDRLADRDDVDVVVTTGGTGVTPDDVTIEAVTNIFAKELPGFGELFRRLSYDDIGTKVVGTRATAGVLDGVPVFCLPGSENAARLGAEEIIAAEAGHLAGLAGRE